MGLRGRFWLGLAGSETLFETGWSSFVEQDVPIEREGRVASGKLVWDVIAEKKRFTVTFADHLTQETLDAFLAEYNRGVPLSLKVERSNDTVDEYTVKIRPISRKRLDAMSEPFRWNGAAVILEEV